MGKIKLNFLDKIVLVVAICLAIALLLSYRAGSADPRTHILIAFFGLGYPFILIGNLVCCGYWLLRSKTIFWVATLILVFVGIKPLTATFAIMGDEGNAVKNQDDHLRVMTYNVHQFKRYGQNNDESTKNQIIQIIKDQNPDVISFQEFYTRPRGKFDIIDSLKKELGFRYLYYLPSVKNDYESAGLAIFSKYPIKNKGKILFDQYLRGNESIYVDVLFKSRIIRVYNVHLQSISFEKQDYDYLEKVQKMTAEKAAAKRIVYMLKSAFQKRSHQVDIVKQHLDLCQVPYVIMGDFNDTPASYAVTQITSALNNAFTKKGSGWGKTYNGKFPNFQIDYIACTKKIEVVNYHITKALLSDHFPVRSDLKLNYTGNNQSD